MDVKILVKLVFLVLIIMLLIYIRTTKIPVLCIACEEPGTFTRCITGTGEGTPTCAAYKLQVKVMDGIETAYDEVETAFGRVTGPLQLAMSRIQTAKLTLETAFASIGSLNVPSIPSITLPNIGNISCSIDFGAIPAVDICKSGITPGINGGTVNPMNTALGGLQTQINNVVGTLNNTVAPINTSLNRIQNDLNNVVGGLNSSINSINHTLKTTIPTIPTVDIPSINSSVGNVSLPQLQPVNLSCNLDIAAQIRDSLGTTSLDVCGLLITQINTKLIPQLNAGFLAVEAGINIAITAINTGITNAINAIKNGITTAILMLEQQLDSLNIFGGLTTKMVDLISKIESLDPIGLIKIYVVPYISAIFPFATLADILIFLLFLASIPFIIPFFLIVNSLINLIPDINIPLPNIFGKGKSSSDSGSGDSGSGDSG